jgi:membrane-associated phospholipid phosphatase
VPAGLASVGYFLGGREFLIPAAFTTVYLAHLTTLPIERSRVVRTVAGVAMAGVAVEVVKTAVGRGRPREVDDPRRFQPFVRENAWMSFPSGHAAAGFAIAAAVDQEFELGRWESMAAYGLAGLIGWSRIYDDAHWTSDTVAGSIIGLATARATVGWLQQRADGRGPSVGLDVAADGAPLLSFSVPVR